LAAKSTASLIGHDRSAFTRVALFATCAALVKVTGRDTIKLAVDMATELKRSGILIV